MISVENAISLILDNTTSQKNAIKKVDDALGYVAAENVFSPINMPPFRQSAMDGYAVCLDEKNEYTLTGEIAAGKSANNYEMKKGEAIRIFTGAHVPESADAVAMQEIASKMNGSVSFNKPINSGDNIRPIGEQIKEGEVALKKGNVLNAASVGFLYGLGITDVPVLEKPSIALIATGSELALPGLPLPDGKIYESNSFMIHAALKQSGYRDVEVNVIADDYATTFDVISKALEEKDIVIISGGISVGDYDFVGKALQENGVNEIFYKVKQKPGKPLFFGERDGKYVFGLPGNPAAALTSFYVYVLRALDKFSGKENTGLPQQSFPIAHDFINKNDRAQFLKASLENNTVKILEGQSSAMLKSFAAADCMAYIPAESAEIKKGTAINCYLLPN